MEIQSDVNEARAYGLDLAIMEVERLLTNAKASGQAHPAYLAALKEVNVFLRPMAMRTRKGEYPHPTSSVDEWPCK